MRLRAVNADGTQNEDQEFSLTALAADGQPYDPPVVIRCRPCPPKQRRKFEKQAIHPVKDPVSRGMRRETDYEELADLVVGFAILGWEGIDGADGHPLICNEATKVHLPPHIKSQVWDAVTTTEAAESSAESFRESADLVGVVGGRGGA